MTNNKENKQSDKKSIDTKKWTWWAVVIVLLLYFGYFSAMYLLFPGNLERRGQFGDMFGALGTLFSGLAFAGLIITILQQREDLKNQRDEISLQRVDLEKQTEALQLQREEIAQTNEELKLQCKEMEEQNKTIMLQRFENTFFNMIDMQQKILNELRYLQTGDFVQEHVGRKAIKELYSDIYYQCKVKKISTLDGCLNEYYQYVEDGQLDHYFRHLYRIIRYVDDYDINVLSVEEKYKYLCLLRAQLSKDELLIIFYNCISEYGCDKFKPLVEKYALFKNIRVGSLILTDHSSEFEKSAYEFLS